MAETLQLLLTLSLPRVWLPEPIASAISVRTVHARLAVFIVSSLPKLVTPQRYFSWWEMILYLKQDIFILLISFVN